MPDEPLHPTPSVPAGERVPSTTRGAVSAAATLATITLLRLALGRFGDELTPFFLYLVPVALGAWHGGLHVGVVTTVAAALLGQYFFVEPRASWSLPHDQSAEQVLLFLAQALSASLLVARAAGDRRRALISVREGHAALDKLHGVLDAVDDGIMVQDATGRVLYANETAARAFGFPSVSALRGATAAATLSGVEIFDEERRPLPHERMPGRNARDTRQSVEMVLLFRVSASGEERWCAVRSKPLFNADGTPSSVISLMHDVTRRRRDEARRAFVARVAQELSSSLDYHETIAKLTRLSVPEIADWAAVDFVEDGRRVRRAVVHADPAKVAIAEEIERRFPLSSDAKRNAPNILRTGEPEILSTVSEESIAALAPDPEHLALVRALGLRSVLAVPIMVRGAPMGVLTFATAESGRHYGPDDLALATTLAERASVAMEHAVLYREAEQARADAELANRSKDEFLAMLGHELRNPLAPILTALSLVKMRTGPWPERELAVIERQVKHLVRLVDDLLDVSRITRGRVELKLERLALGDVVSRAVEMSLPLIEQRAHRLDVEVPPELALRGDALRLAQVVANLLNNAAKYTEKGGSIEVRGARVGPWVELRVRDRGIGITAAMLPRVFELFTQESQAIDRALGGLGLGLAIVKSLVTQHGGEVSAASEGAGLGSEFCVRLPALDEGSSAPGDEAVPEPAAATSALRVLVVDDNEDAADMLADALAAMGHEVRKAHDGPTALEVAAEQRPTVAVLDIGLPVMDGHELARRLRAMEGMAGVRLIAVTGYGQDADRRRTAEAGFDAHLVKPVDLDELATLVAG